MSKRKHHFKLLCSTDRVLNRDYTHHVFECELCYQVVTIEKEFMTYLLTVDHRFPFALKHLQVVPACNPKRKDVVINLPEVPMCAACGKRAVASPGSKGLEGALCMVCVYDL